MAKLTGEAKAESHNKLKRKLLRARNAKPVFEDIPVPAIIEANEDTQTRKYITGRYQDSSGNAFDLCGYTVSLIASDYDPSTDIYTFCIDVHH